MCVCVCTNKATYNKAHFITVQYLAFFSTWYLSICPFHSAFLDASHSLPGCFGRPDLAVLLFLAQLDSFGLKVVELALQLIVRHLLRVGESILAH